MDVRCPGCGRPVSEWAARCPVCRTDLAGAEPVPEPVRAPEPAPPVPSLPPASPPVASLPAGPGQPARPDRRRSRRRLLTGGAAVAAVAVAVVAVALTRSGTSHGGTAHRPVSNAPARAVVEPAPRGPGAPGLSSVAAAGAERLRGQRLFVSDGAATAAVLADGTVLQRFASSAGDGSEPVPVGQDSVVYLHRGDAYAFDAATGHDPRALGPADGIFAAGSARIDLVNVVGGRQFVDPTALDGVGTGPTFEVPAGDRVAGVSARGVVLEAPDRDLEVLRDGRDEPVTGAVSHVVAVAGDEVAWTSISGCRQALTDDCPLHLTNLATGSSRTVRTGAAIGFAGTGTLSPDGGDLAIYSLPTRPQTTARLDLSVVRVSTGAVRRLGSVLVAGSFMPTVTWSPSGEWIFFGGSGSFDAFDFASPDPAEAPDQPIPLPLSVTCCIVGF